MALNQLRAELHNLANKQRAQSLQRFFKTGPGQYGEGDLFLGIRVPELRQLAREYRSIPTDELPELLNSSFHEERLIALFILVRAYSRGNQSTKESVYRAYLNNIQSINNWDLVDCSAPHIVGDFLMDKSKELLYSLAGSAVLWERRISVMSTFHFIKHGEFSDALRISKILLSDKEDLIHKAVGWMLREVGKRDIATEEEFLRKHYKVMPRTMLRYAIEKFPEARRQMYLKGII